MKTKVATTQSVYISQHVDVEIRIDIDDVMQFLERCTPEELNQLNGKLAETGSNFLEYKPASMMEEFAMKELQEVLRFNGPEFIMGKINS